MNDLGLYEIILKNSKFTVILNVKNPIYLGDLFEKVMQEEEIEYERQDSWV